MDIHAFGRRDIFGYLLPGMIFILLGAYALSAALAPFQFSVGNVIKHEFLFTVLLFVSSYLVGSLLRLYSTDKTEDHAKQHLLKVWRKRHPECTSKDCESQFQKIKDELLKGSDVTEVPEYFDSWLQATDEFPYTTCRNRFWQLHEFREVLEFFRQNYRSKMWSPKMSARSFFSYCKLAIIDGGGPLADEVKAAEGLTRFFAGTFVSLRLSIWMLLASCTAQIFAIIGAVLVQRTGTPVLDWQTQSIYLALSLVLVFVALWMCRQISSRFRRIRYKEVGIVFHAFYLYIVQPYKQEEEQEREKGVWFKWLWKSNRLP